MPKLPMTAGVALFGLVVLLGAAACREYTTIAAEAVERVAPSADEPTPVATVSAQTSVSPAPPLDAGPR